HINPSSRGGPDDGANLALACRSCNIHKSARLLVADPQTLLEVRLLHPREDRWEDHFRVGPESGTIDGLTPTGRATVVALNMNSDAQRAARRQWMRLGVSP